ncbi:MAG: hypothetical protein ACYCTI_03515 [Acidimicrobiales bacterium]
MERLLVALVIAEDAGEFEVPAIYRDRGRRLAAGRLSPDAWAERAARQAAELL